MPGKFTAFLTIWIAAILTMAACKAVHFKSAPGYEKSDTISATIYKPEGTGPFPAVILLHGCAGITEGNIVWAKDFTRWGYVAIIVDSFSNRGVTNICDFKGRVISSLERMLDAFGAARYLNNLPYVRKGDIGIIGYSHGGTTVLKAMRKDAPVLAAADSSTFKAGVALYPYCGTYGDGKTVLPTLLLIGADDDWTPAHLCEHLDKAWNHAQLELVVYEGATHSFDNARTSVNYKGHWLVYDPEAAADARKRVRRFFDQHLAQ